MRGAKPAKSQGHLVLCGNLFSMVNQKPPEPRNSTVPSSRLSRLMRMGQMATGVAGNMLLAGARELAQGKRPKLSDLLLTPANAVKITQQLAQMRGAAMKVGQLISMDAGDLLPPEMAAILARLRSDAHAMPQRQVQAVLTQTGANATRLELELTESQLLDDIPGVIAKMDALRALGVRLALDDFGTGYSSLAMLKRLPLNQLKIDQAFVRDMLLDPQDAAIIRAIITMGESLSLNVIAEGVELVEQRDALLALGCRHYQGYLFGRPQPISQGA